MPKINLNNAFATQSSPERKKLASDATSMMTGGNINAINDKSLLNVKSLKLDKIQPRNVNEFTQENIDSLADSIEKYGLINPISVVHDAKKDTYTISSGHRRYAAMSQLHNTHTENKDFEEIDCSIYELTDDKMLLAQGLPYISYEQEQGIYRDSNLETRQLTYSDVAHQIRHIVEKFDDPSYIDKLRERALQDGVKTRSDYDRTKLILNVLSTQKYSGWKRETIRQYLKIWEAKRTDLINDIENGKIKVSAAYKSMIEDNNLSRNRRTNKIIGLTKAVDAIKKEVINKTYSIDEQKELYELAKYIMSLVTEYKE